MEYQRRAIPASIRAIPAGLLLARLRFMLGGKVPLAAAQAGWLDERQAALESLTAIKRAGADLIISYWTKDLAQWL